MVRERGRRVAVGKMMSRAVCDECVSMVMPPEELEGAPAGARARTDVDAPPSVPEFATSAWERPTVRATASTTVAVVSRGPGSPAKMAVWLALAAATLAATGIVWLLLSSGPP